MSDKNSNYRWWQTGVVYQIYPRSFQDSNGDGIGDLPGITQRLDYLSDILGVDAVWLSPIYPSPMHDFGYDVADYTDIHPLFGSLADFDRLLMETHERGMKLILDLVPNHTSDEHPWSLESRSSRDNRKRDWYLWRDPAPDGGPIRRRSPVPRPALPRHPSRTSAPGSRPRVLRPVPRARSCSSRPCRAPSPWDDDSACEARAVSGFRAPAPPPSRAVVSG